MLLQPRRSAVAVEVDLPRKQRLDGRLVADGEAEVVGQRGFQCLHEAAGGGVVKLVGGFVQIEDLRAGDEARARLKRCCSPPERRVRRGRARFVRCGRGCAAGWRGSRPRGVGARR